MERIGYVNVCVLLLLYQASLITAFTLMGSSTNATAGFQFNITCETSSIYLVFQKDSISLCVISGGYPNGTCQFIGGFNANYTYSCTPASNTYKVIIPGSLVTERVHKSQWSCGDPFGPGLAQYVLYVNVPVSSVNISSKPTDTNPVKVIQGRAQTFSCTTNAGRPQARIQWYLSTINITASATLQPDVCYTDCKDDKVISSSELTYVGNLNDDGQTIYCTVVNTIAGGVRSTDKTIVILYGPSQINIAPPTTSYIVTETGSIGPITCTAYCKPNCTLTWNGANIPAGTTSILSLQNIGRNQSGNYQCTAVNGVSSMTSNNISIVVKYGPGFAKISPSTELYTVKEKQNIGPITCTAGCNPNCTMTWTGPNLPAGTTSILNLQNIDRNQSGHYQCTAINEISSVTSVIVSIIVNYGPSQINIIPPNTSYIVTEKGSIDPITCTANCKPNCTLTWTGPNIPAGTTSILNLQNIDRNQSGNYQCTAINDVSSMTSNNVSIIVKYNPTIIEIDNNQTVRENTTVVVTCKVESNPLSNVVWMFENKPLNTDETYILSNKLQGQYVLSILTIYRIRCLSMGTYHCVASNMLGETRRSIYVTVECSPRIQCLECLRSVIPIKAEEILNITVPIIAFPKPTIFWRFLENGLPVNVSGETFYYENINKHSTTFLKRNLKSFDFGFYRLYAYNDLGNMTDVPYSFEVKSVKDPTVPTFVHVFCKYNTATLIWQSSVNGDIEQYFKVQLWTFEESTRTTLLQNVSVPGFNSGYELTVKDLSFQTNYWFIIFAINTIGNSSSKIVNCTTDEKQENASCQVWIGLFASSISASVLTVTIIAAVQSVRRLQKIRKKSKRSKNYIDMGTVASSIKDAYTTLKDVALDNQESKAQFENIAHTYDECSIPSNEHASNYCNEKQTGFKKKTAIYANIDV